MASRAAAPLLVVLLVALSLALDAASAQDLSAIPPACLGLATTFQQACATELEQAQSALGVAPGASSGGGVNATAAQADAAIARYAQTAPPPSAECCKASCAFNNQGCACSPGVVALAASFLSGGDGGGDSSQVLTTIAKAFASGCARAAQAVPYTPYAGEAACMSAPAPGSPQAEAAVAACGAAAGTPAAAAAAPAPAAAAAPAAPVAGA
jgi:hypothetical protein